MTIEPSVLIDSLSASEGGVARIRKVLLEFAVRGALSEKDSGDPPARELLQYATKDRTAQAVAAPGRSKRRTLPRRSLEAPFALPVTWEWIAIGDAMNLVNGRAFKPSHWGSTGLPIVRIQNLNNSSAPFNYCSFEVAPKFHLKPGDFLISWSGTPGTSFGAFIWEGPPGILNQHIFRAELFGGIYNPKFLRVAINARLDEMIARAHGGVGLQHITKGELESMLIPLPPLAEQKRIVAKVDQLMALCDDLEAKQTKKRDLATQSTRSALTALTTAETAEDLSTAWHRVVKNFNLTTSDSAAINGLRSAILGLAVRGQLVRDCPRTGGGAPHGPLPQGWHWVKVSEAGDLKLGRQRAPQHHIGPNMRPYLRVANVFEARLDLSDVMEMNFEPEEAERFELRPNDVLLNEGQSTELVGRPAIYRGEIPGVCFQNTLIRFRPSKLVIPEYALTVFRAYMRTGRFQREAQQTTNIAHLSLGRLATVEFPLPPLPEQKRIVAKVDHLMSLLDDLEAKLRKQEETATCLAESLAAAVTAS